jgi:hypothetical protein
VTDGLLAYRGRLSQVKPSAMPFAAR